MPGSSSWIPLAPRGVKGSNDEDSVRITFRPVLFKRWVTTVHAHKFMPHFHADILLRLLQVGLATKGPLKWQKLLCLATRHLQCELKVLTSAERTGPSVG